MTFLVRRPRYTLVGLLGLGVRRRLSRSRSSFFTDLDLEEENKTTMMMMMMMMTLLLHEALYRLFIKHTHTMSTTELLLIICSVMPRRWQRALKANFSCAPRSLLPSRGTCVIQMFHFISCQYLACSKDMRLFEVYPCPFVTCTFKTGRSHRSYR